MLIELSENLMVNTNDVVKATLNKNGENGWLFIRDENKATHLEPEEYKKLLSYVRGRKLKVVSNHLNLMEQVKIDYTRPHKFAPVMDDANLCTCGKYKDEILGLHYSEGINDAIR